MNRHLLLIATALLFASPVLAAAGSRARPAAWSPIAQGRAPATINPLPIQPDTALPLFDRTASAAPATVRAAHNDIDGNGRSDLLWYSTWHLHPRDSASIFDLAYWRMDGTNVVSKHTYRVSTGFRNEATGDFDGDGRSDILWFAYDFGSPDTRIFLWRSRGDASFDAPYVASVPKQWNLVQMGASADINGDGRDDIIWQNRITGQAAYWLMDGTAVLGSYVFDLHPDCILNGAGDFDGDGRDDLLCNDQARGLLYFMRNSGDGGFGYSMVRAYDPKWWRMIGNPDLNGDGRADIVWFNSQIYMVAFWWMDGATVLREDTRWGGSAGSTVATGDFDGDGLGDIVSLEGGGYYPYVLLWRSLGDGNFDTQLLGETATRWTFM
ncbi:MAG: VCBS repeat-containing protein [Lysobacter sp.]|nr:VCBS repeat-containing protein [Lysobacter sp.]